MSEQQARKVNRREFLRMTALTGAGLLAASCDPATQARDAAAFVAAGYRPRRLRVLDMFPQSAHVESLLWLSDADGTAQPGGAA